MIVISDKEAIQMEMNRLSGELDGIRVDRRYEAKKIPYAVSEAAAMRDVFQRAMYEYKDRAEAAEARCKALETRLETAEKMVKEYQDVIVPGYRERAEKVEKERDAAVSDMEALMCNCVDGCHVCANAIVVQTEPCVRLDCSLKGQRCNPKWRGKKEE